MSMQYHQRTRFGRIPAFVIGCVLFSGLAFAGDSWTSFQNGGSTSIQCRGLPTQWSPERGIAWSASLPGYGQSSPVVWKGRVFVTAIDGDRKEHCYILALEVKTGKLLWKRKLTATVQQKNSYMVSRAAPTPVVDENALYVLFESGDLHAFTHEGKQKWKLALFENNKAFKNGHGYGSSPTQTDDAVIILIDHRGPSSLLAISKKTGKPVWKTSRTSRSSWTSPQVTRIGKRQQIVVSSTGTVDGYDAKTGKQLWSHRGLSGNTIPSVTVRGDLVFVGAGVSQRQPSSTKTTASNCCLRITPDVKPGYRLLWKAQKGWCHYVSPLVHRGKVYYVNRVGAVHCLDARTGKHLNVKRMSSPCWAQPIACDNRIFLFHKDGTTTVFEHGSAMRKLASNRLWKADAPPLPDRNYDYEPQGPKDTRPAKPARSYLDPLVYGVVAIDHTFVVRIGTHLYCVSSN